jgi:fermentation-respiration switch protein FrsA (DUF1100 family)
VSRNRLARVLIWIVGAPLIAYLAVLGYLYVCQRQLLYFPDPSRPFLAGLPQLGVREVALSTEDGLSLLSWYLPPGDGRPVIAYFHGNGGNIAYRADRLMRFAREGYGVLLVEYRGYGGNPGSPSEAGLVADGRAALDFLRHEGIAAGRLVLYGESLGSGVAVHLAATQQIGALLLESPYTSVAAVAQYHYPYVPAAQLIWDRFDSLSRIGEVRAPILVLYGGRDAVVPDRFSRALLAAAPEPKESWLAAAAGHEDLARFDALESAISFIERHVLQP